MRIRHLPEEEIHYWKWIVVTLCVLTCAALLIGPICLSIMLFINILALLGFVFELRYYRKKQKQAQAWAGSWLPDEDYGPVQKNRSTPTTRYPYG